MATLKEAISIARQEPTSERSIKLMAAIHAGKMDEIAAKEGIDLTKFKELTKSKMAPQQSGAAAAGNLAGGLLKGVMNATPTNVIEGAEIAATKLAPSIGKSLAEKGKTITEADKASFAAYDQAHANDTQQLSDATQKLNSVGVVPDANPTNKVDDVVKPLTSSEVLQQRTEAADKVVPEPLKTPSVVGGDFGTGVAKGALNTAMGTKQLMDASADTMTKLAETALHLEPTVDKKQQAYEEGKNKVTTPENAMETAGMVAEQIGEFILPMGAVSKAEKGVQTALASTKLSKTSQAGLSLLSRAAIEGSVAGVQSAMQSGKVDKSTADTALISAAMPVASSLVKWMTTPFKNPDKMSHSAAEIAKIIRPSTNAYTFGKNPAQAVVDEGIIANNMDDLVNKIAGKKEEIGRLIAENVDNASAGTADVTKILQSNADDYAKVVTDPDSWKTYSKKVGQLGKEFKADLATGELVETGVQDLTNATASDVWKLQKRVGQLAKWTGQAGDNEANKQLMKLYSKLGAQLDDMAKGTKDLQMRYANMIGAEKAAEARAAVVARNSGIVGTGVGGLIGTATGPVSNVTGSNDPLTKAADFLVGTIALKARNSPAFRTRFAQFLNAEANIPKEQAAQVIKGIVKWGFSQSE